jgi:thymidylate synthase (FAD)
MKQSVKLVSYTVPHGEHPAGNPEQLISYIARVSNPANQENFDTAQKLWGYCLRKSHWSPFEMADVTLEIKTTRDIGRQILRHRSFSFQEFSQRYARVEEDDFFFREARLQDTKNRQNSIELDEDSQFQLIDDWNGIQQEVKNVALRAYRWALEAGIAKEQARAVLPEGMTPSTMYMKGSLRSWIHYCALRRSNGTQKEHRQIANMAWVEICRIFPTLQEFNFWMDETGDIPILKVEKVEKIVPSPEPTINPAQKESMETMHRILESYTKNSASGLPY